MVSKKNESEKIINLLNIEINKKLVKRLGSHQAAVKALAFNPVQKNILVSGSGTADRRLRIFDTKTFSEKYKSQNSF